MRKQNPWKTVCAPKEIPAAALLRGGERADAAAQMCILGTCDRRKGAAIRPFEDDHGLLPKFFAAS